MKVPLLCIQKFIVITSCTLTNVLKNYLLAITFVPLQTFVGLECSHRFCHRCWKEYITTKVMDEHVGEVSSNLFVLQHWFLHRYFFLIFNLSFCQNISCPAHKCDILVDEVFVG